jgi:glycosyltransferase involved in cell wall biosynthesis
VLPAGAINRTRRHSAKLLNINEFGSNSSLADEVCSSADIIVIYCYLIEPVLSAIQYWKARDKVVIVDFDHAYDLMPSSNPNYQYWFDGIKSSYKTGKTAYSSQIDPYPLTQFKWGISLAHAATVPSLRLVDDWRDYTDMHYLPDYIDLENYRNVKPESHDGINIGWGGNMSHLLSFQESGVVEALRRVCESRPQVRVVIAGGDQRVYDLLPVPTKQKILIPWVPYTQWAQILSKFDIGIAPLYGPYDERRSWIRVLEYLVMKIPWVGSNGPTYFELGDYGWLIKNDTDSWEGVLLDIVDNLQEYKLDASRIPYLFGISQSIDENVEKILAIYQKVMNQVNGL